MVSLQNRLLLRPVTTSVLSNEDHDSSSEDELPKGVQSK